jgi:hypothetical protein
MSAANNDQSPDHRPQAVPVKVVTKHIEHQRYGLWPVDCRPLFLEAHGPATAPTDH